MSMVMFWDPGHGYAANVAAACAVTVGLHYPLRVLLLNDGRHGSGVEEGLRAGSRHAPESGPGDTGAMDTRLSEYGADALLRLSASGLLTKANYSDYTLPVIRGRLDLATGVRAGDLRGTSGFGEGEGLLELAMAAEQSYDLVLRHAPRIREACRKHRPAAKGRLWWRYCSSGGRSWTIFLPRSRINRWRAGANCAWSWPLTIRAAP